jgi:large subunit ribosomal protein L11
MSKKITKLIKLQIAAGKATPAPPVGTALGPAGINIGDFVSKFNERTRPMMGDIIPCVITVYEDRTYDFILKTPPASRLILKKMGKDKGSSTAPKVKIGKITRAQVTEIATEKMPDLNAASLQAAERIIMGTARSMGVDIA